MTIEEFVEDLAIKEAISFGDHDSMERAHVYRNCIRLIKNLGRWTAANKIDSICRNTVFYNDKDVSVRMVVYKEVQSELRKLLNEEGDRIRAERLRQRPRLEDSL